MSDEPRMAWMKIAPQCLAIVGLSALFVSGIDRDAAPNTRVSFPEIARQLRVGMSMNEVHAMILGAGGRCRGLAGSAPYSMWSFYVDAKGEYDLNVCSKEKGNFLAGQFDSRLVKWDLHRR